MSDNLPTETETETETETFPVTLIVKPTRGFLEELKDRPDDARFIANVLDYAKGPKGQKELALRINLGRVRLSGAVSPKQMATHIRSAIA